MIGGHIPENVISGKLKLTTFRFAKSQKGEWKDWKPVLSPQYFEIENRFYGDLSIGYFTFQQDKSILWCEGQIRDSKTGDEYAPISIEFTIDNDAPKTEHKIEFIFKYRFDNEWYISKEFITINIRSWIEKNAVWASILTTISFGFLYSILRWLLQKIEIENPFYIHFSIGVIIGIVINFFILVYFMIK